MQDHPTPDEAIAGLKATVLDRLVEKWGDAASLRRQARLQQLSRADLRADAERRRPELAQQARAAGLEIDSRSYLLTRIIELALDALFSESLAPELRLSLAPRSLPTAPVHALIFTAFPCITHELYPLMVDAYAGTSPMQVVGIHEEWLAGQTFRRAILFDEESGGLLESDLIGAPEIAGAQLQMLDLQSEAENHQRIERTLAGIPLLNPYAGSRRLDDKGWTGACWQRAGLPTPDALLITADTPIETVRRRLGDRVVIKPVDGTEGRGVEFRNLREDDRPLPVGRLVMEERGSLRVLHRGEPVRFTIRVNVCCDGAKATAESGYAQVAHSSMSVASVGRGGSLMPLTDLWAALCTIDGVTYTPTAADWHRVVNLAEEGATALAKALNSAMPALIGIDLLPDLTPEGTLAPVLLEANPRPAGMSHSRLFTQHGPGDTPGVSQRLWRVVKIQRKEARR